jgi:hypothetical protein
MASNAGKTVEEILKGKKASIKQAELEEGSPSWDDILGLTWEEIEEESSESRTRIPNYPKVAETEKV